MLCSVLAKQSAITPGPAELEDDFWPVGQVCCSTPIHAINLGTLDELYAFVESAMPRTGLILLHNALYCPWARSVSAAVPEVRWVQPAQPAVPAASMQLHRYHAG